MTTMTDLMRDVLRSDSLFAEMSDKDFDTLIDQISPAETGPDFAPDDDVKKMLAAFWTSHDARRVIDWLLDITIRAPYPVTGPNRDDLAFAAAKHGLHGLTRQLAFELGPFAITVNAVAPGLQPVSPHVLAQWESYGPEKQAAAWLKQHHVKWSPYNSHAARVLWAARRD